jgi:hypothetical protein
MVQAAVGLCLNSVMGFAITLNPHAQSTRRPGFQ